MRSFRLGADYQIAFYGLLCAEKIAAPLADDLSNDVALPDWQDAGFLQSPVFQATILLYASDQPILAERFATHLAETLPEDQIPQLVDFLEEIKNGNIAASIFYSTTLIFAGLVVATAIS